MSSVDVAVAATGLTKLQEYGAVVTLFTVIVVALVWDRLRILADHKELSNNFNQTMKENADVFRSASVENAKVIERNTAAMEDFRETLRDISKKD